MCSFFIKFLKPQKTIDNPMTLRNAISLSFNPEVWDAIQTHLSSPELLKMACLEEFKKNSSGVRIEMLRSAMKRLDETGEIRMNYDYDPIP